MAIKPATVTCDGCGREKTETNHWWAIFDGFPLLHIRQIADVEPESMAMWRHYCGQECALKSVSLWMEGPPNAIPEGR